MALRAPQFIEIHQGSSRDDAVREHLDLGVADAVGRFLLHVGIDFRLAEHGALLAHSKMLLEQGTVTKHPKFDKLITSLSAAVEIDGKLDKESTNYDDIYDGFRLSLK